MVRITFTPAGRTGNNIFQYMTCKLLVLLWKQTHKYISFDEFTENDKKNAFYINDDNILQYINNPPSLQIDIICNGFFQKSEFFIPYREQLLKIICDQNNDDYFINGHGQKKSIASYLFSTHKINDLTQDDIVISLRLDDFIQLPCPKSDIIPPNYYTDIIENYGKPFNRLFIVCDKIRYNWEHEYLKFFNKWNPILLQESLEHDCSLLKETPVLIHSNSTLCWIMSFLSDTPNKKRWIPNTFFYGGQSLNKIQTDTDVLIHVNTLSHNDVYNINVKNGLFDNIRPLSYSIPDECVVSGTSKKNNVFSYVVPGTNTNYMYDCSQRGEDEYNEQYKNALFANTQKKGGWDCLRHYEILANGCIPCFDNLINCPKDTMTTFPKTLVLEAQKELLPWKPENTFKYNSYIQKIMQHVREQCTTSATAKYVLSIIQPKIASTIKNVLLIVCHNGVNYTRETFWIGMKRHIESMGGLAVEYPKIEYLYDSFPEGDKQHIHGRGFTYSRRLKEDGLNYREDEIVEKIKAKYWDVIVYGKVGPDEFAEGSIPTMPLWKHVFKRYGKNEIVFLYGGDECIDLTTENHYKHHIMHHCQYGHCFVRELKK